MRLDQLWAEDRLVKFILGSTLVLGALARLAPIATNRFHQDEALYSTWALHIATGRDTLLNGFPVDKPPLFLYVLALFFRLLGPSEVVARLPGVLASTVSVALVYHLARRLYGRPAALAAAALMALSPFNILFAPTALTDPLLVALVLAAVCLAVEGRWTWAGVMAGLAAATKQQGLLFLPLVVGVGLIGTAAKAERVSENSVGSVIARSRSPDPERSEGEGAATKQSFLDGLRLLRCPFATLRALARNDRKRWGAYALNDGPHFILGFLAALAPAILWDLARSQRPGFLQQSALSYGGLTWVAPSQWLERGQEWADLLWYATASRPLNLMLVVGVPLLLLYGLLWRRRERETILDIILGGFGLFFLVLHLVLDFQVWDRYLLGLVPIVLLLLARVLCQVYDGLAALWWGIPNWLGAIFTLKWGKPKQVWGSGKPLSLSNAGNGRKPTLESPGERGFRHLLWRDLAVPLLLMAMLYRPAQDAANSRFPIGGDQGAYQGIEAVADYFRGNVGAGATLYQRWLGWHLAFYLFNYPYDFQWYDSPQQLAEHAAQVTGRRYLVAPSWKSVTEEKVALAEKGLSLQPIYQTYRRDGSVSFTIYRVEETGRE